MTADTNIVLAFAESGTIVDDFDAELAEWYSLCTTDCWKGDNVEDPYWLANSEVYY
jgi:hypothetical protein